MGLPVKDAVLGILAREENAFYRVLEELRSLSETPVHKSSVFRAFQTLERAGLIEEHEPPGRRAGAATFYRATDDGHQALERYLSGAPGSQDDLRLRLRVARPKDLPLLIAAVTTAEGATLKRLTELREHQQRARRRPRDEVDPAVLAYEVLLSTHDAAELQSRAERLRDLRVALQNLRNRPDRRRTR